MQTAQIRLFPKHCTICINDTLNSGKGILVHNANLELVLDRLYFLSLTVNLEVYYFLLGFATVLRNSLVR